MSEQKKERKLKMMDEELQFIRRVFESSNFNSRFNQKEASSREIM